MNILAYLFIKTHSYWFMGKNGIAETWNMGTFHFRCYCPSGFVGLHTQQQSMRVLVGMCLSKHLEFFFPPFWWIFGGISLWLLFDFADN